MVSASHTVHMLLIMMVKVQLGVTVYSKIMLNSVMVKFVLLPKEEGKLRILALLLCNKNNAQLT